MGWRQRPSRTRNTRARRITLTTWMPASSRPSWRSTAWRSSACATFPPMWYRSSRASPGTSRACSRSRPGRSWATSSSTAAASRRCCSARHSGWDSRAAAMCSSAIPRSRYRCRSTVPMRPWLPRPSRRHRRPAGPGISACPPAAASAMSTRAATRARRRHGRRCCGTSARSMPACREVMDIISRRFNEVTMYRFGRIVDFLKLHYALTRRTDTAFWRDNVDPATLPQRLRDLLTLWQHQSPWYFDEMDRLEEVFPAASYQYVLYGMGFRTAIAPEETADTAAAAARLVRENERQIQELRTRLPTNRELLGKIYQY